MPFVVKATYRNETRKFLFSDSHFPSYEELYHQLYRVFAIGHAYYLSKLLFSPQEGTRILIGMEAHSAVEYDIHCAPFKGHFYPTGRLMFSVFDETPHKIPASRLTAQGSFIHPIPPAPPAPFFAPPPPPPPPPPSPPQQRPQKLVLDTSFQWSSSSAILEDTRPQPMDVDPGSSMRQSTSAMDTECCSVAHVKKEVKTMMDDFLHDFARIMGDTFGEDHSFPDQMDTPTIRHKESRGPSPLPAMEFDGSLHIPGSFIQPRPPSSNAIEDDPDIEKSQTSPKLEHLQKLHPGVWCDFCGTQIRGLRFKCQECVDYDLCANCIVVSQALDKHNAETVMIHKFNTLSPPAQKDATPVNIMDVLAPQVRRTASCTAGTPGRAVHSGIRCDVCRNVVVGSRHKCMSCPDYDLCDKCIGAAPTEHPMHRFITLETPGRIYFQTRPASPVTNSSSMPHSARCNLCDSRILGDRYKCTDCPDFDTCSSCFAITIEQHPFHSFVKVTKPADFMVRRKPELTHHFATCDACNKNIIGVRYKCMHPDCPDFDLCQDCEALPITVHPSTHSFLKIKRGDVGIPSVKRNSPRVAAEVPLADLPRPVAIPIPGAVSADAVDSESSPSDTARAVPMAPPSPIERLHAIRAQAERRLCARMQQLQSYPFSDGSATPAVDPIIEERLIRERKEAEERAHMMEKEIEELEKARRRKHNEALKQPSHPYLESVKAALADKCQAYDKFSIYLRSCSKTSDPAAIARSIQQMRNFLKDYPDLLDGLDAFVAKEVVTPVPTKTTPTEPASTEPAPIKATPAEPASVEPAPTRATPAEPASTEPSPTKATFTEPASAEPAHTKDTPTEPAPEPQTSIEEQHPSEDVPPATPEMVQKKTSFFGNPFIHPLESPLHAMFVSDNNIPDGHIFPAGAEFVKSWRLENDGTEPWAEGTKVVFVGGRRLGAFANAPTTYDVGVVLVGEETDVCAGDMKAPEVPGRYISHWRLRDPQGRYFGPRMWCDIEVLEVESDNSQHGSLVNSAVIMPETAPEHTAASVGDNANLLSSPCSPVTVPSSIVTGTDDASSETSSVGSVSLVSQSDSDWDEIPAIPSRRFSVPPVRETAGEEVEYQVLYDSASDDA